MILGVLLLPIVLFLVMIGLPLFHAYLHRGEDTVL